MRVITLAISSMTRLLRHRALMVAVFVFPLLAGVVAVVSPGLFPVLVWLCPLGCAAMICTSLLVQSSVDGVSGLTTAILCAPLAERTLVMSRVVAGVMLVCLQMAIFGLILLLR